MKYLKNINTKQLKKYELFESISADDLNLNYDDVDEFFDDDYEVHDITEFGPDFLRQFIDIDNLDETLKRDYIAYEEVENFSDCREYIENYESDFTETVKEKIKDDHEDDYEEDMDFSDMLDLLDDSDFSEMILNDDDDKFLEEKWEEYYGSGMDYLESIYGSEIPMEALSNFIDEDAAKQDIKDNESEDFKNEYFINNALGGSDQDEWLEKLVKYDEDNALKLFNDFDDLADYFNTYKFQYLVLSQKIQEEISEDIDDMNKDELKELETEYKDDLIDIIDEIDSKYELDLDITNKFPTIYRKMKIKRSTIKFKI